MSTIRKVCNVCRAELRVPLEAQSVLCPVCRNINSYSRQGNQYTNYSNGLSGNMNVNNRYHQGPFSSPPQRQPPVHVWPRVPQQFSPRFSTGYGSYQPPPPQPQYSSRPPPGNGYYQQPFQASSPPPFHSGYYEQDLHPSDYNDNNYQAPSNLPSSLPRPSPQVSPPQVQNNGYYQQPFQTSPQVSTLQVHPLRPSPQIPLHSFVQVQQGSTPPARANSYIQQPSQQSSKVSNPPKYGRKRAVICGVSYQGQKCSLDGSINDAISMKEFLVRHRSFQDSSIILLTDDDMDPSRIPTKRNMQMALHWLVEGCQPGDSLVFYYSGHGSRERDFDGDEIDGFDEMLCPVDYKTAGKISDDDINAAIVRPLPQGAKLHAIIDTCFSGSIIDLSFMCRMDRKGETTWEDQRLQYAEYKGTSGGLAISISACDDHQTCGDTTAFTGTSAGALTHSFIETMTREPKLTYGSLLKSMRDKVTEAQERLGQPPQDPQLASSEKFDVHLKPIVL